FILCRAQPPVIIKFTRNRHRIEVFLSHPIEFPVETRMFTHSYSTRPSQQSTFHELFYRINGGAHAIQVRLEPKPGIQAKYPSILTDRLFYPSPLPDCMRHRFLTPYILSRLGGIYRHNTVPMRRSRNM